jgi:hypothetical protein
MTDDLRFERTARDWLELGPVGAPADVVQAALLEIETTPQERDLRVPWRIQTMPTFARALVAAAVVIGLAAGGALLLQRNDAPIVSTPSQSAPIASPVTSASPSTSAPASASSGSLADTPLDGLFVSEKYGYSLPIGPDWAARQATFTWTGPDNSRPVIDEIDVSGTQWGVNAASQALAPGQTFADWIDLFQSPDNAASACRGGPESEWPTRQIGGRDWLWVEGCQGITAITEDGGRAYALTFAGPNEPSADAARLFGRLLEGVQLFPDDADTPPAAPPLDGRFQSDQHGFALSYPAEWTVEQRATTSAPDDHMPVPQSPSLDVLGNADLRLSITSRRLPADQSAAAWARQFCVFTKTVWSPACDQAPGIWQQAPLANDQAWVAVDGDTAGTFPQNDRRLFVATAVKGGRAYEIRLEGNAEESLFLAILASMQLDPASAIDAPPQP